MGISEIFIKVPYLNSGFGKVDLHCDLLTGVDVGVVGLLKGPLQFFELSGSKRSPDPSLLPLLGQHSIVVSRIDFVRQASYNNNCT